MLILVSHGFLYPLPFLSLDGRGHAGEGPGNKMKPEFEKRKQLQIWANHDQNKSDSRCVTKEFRCGVWVGGKSIVCT